MYPASFSYHAPETLEETIALLQRYGEEARLLAGGHSLLPAMKLRLSTPAHLVDMKRLRGSLQTIREEGDTVVIGALATHYLIESSELIRARAPLLAETSGSIGDIHVRNMGTIGGSLAHADPAGDFPAAILAAEAEMVVLGPAGRRSIAASEFFFGFFETALQAGEILTEVRVAAAGDRQGSSYQKFAHPASGYAVCGVAAVLSRSGDGGIAHCRLGITGVADGAYRATAVEEALEGRAFSDELVAQAAEHATDGIEPLEDPFAGAAYRRHLTSTFTRRALATAWERSG